ncbi:MAG: response regulator, partial [Spirulina sp. SIO3F2]|nr:response regulator [Spirulina sp. SIO3F2]
MAENLVLLLEDDPTARETIKGMLPGGKFKLLEVSDSKTALGIIKREAESLRLMVIKFKMPQVPGWKIIQKAQEHPRVQTIPMVLVTSADDAVQKAFPETPEFFEIVEYPCDRTQMQRAVKAAMTKAKRPRSGATQAKAKPVAPPPKAKTAPPPPPAAKKVATPPPPPATKQRPAAPPPPPAAKKVAAPPPPPPAKKRPVAPPPPPAAKKVAAPPPPPTAKQRPAAPPPPKAKPAAPPKPVATPAAVQAKAQPKAQAAPAKPAAKPTTKPVFDPVPYSGGDPFAVGDRTPVTPDPGWQSDDPFAAAIAAGTAPSTTVPAAVSDSDPNDPFAAGVTPTTDTAAADPNDPFLGDYVPDPFDPEPTVLDDQDPFAASANFKSPPAMPPPSSGGESLELTTNEPADETDPLAGAIESLDGLAEEDDPLADSVTSLETLAELEEDDPLAGAIDSLMDDSPEADNEDDPFGGAVMSLTDDSVMDDPEPEPEPERVAVDAPAPLEPTPEPEMAAVEADWGIPYGDFECLHQYSEARDRGVTGLAIGPDGALYTCGP